MRKSGLQAVAIVIIVVASGPVHADAIYEVENARANYRAGLVSAYDKELLDRWGRPSGTYPGTTAIDQSPYVRPSHWKKPSRRRE
jgi:hypothetical protein